MPRGSITKLVKARGFGFITSEEVEQDCFFLFRSVRDLREQDLTTGLQVDFLIERSPKGPRAIDIILV